MRRFFKDEFISLFLLLFLLNRATIYTPLQSQTNGRLINYVSIVHGVSQRLIKLEISDRPSDEMIECLGDILSELQGGEAVHGLPDPDDPIYQMELADPELMWTQIKVEIVANCNGSGDSIKLLALSEDFFGQVNHTIFSADTYLAR